MTTYNCFYCKWSELDSRGFYCGVDYSSYNETEANQLLADAGSVSTMRGGTVYFNKNGDSLPDYTHERNPCTVLDPRGQGQFKDKRS